MAEGILNHLGAKRFQAFSAGSFPSGEVHPLSLVTLQQHGMTAQGYRSKSWDEFQDQPIDLVITVCDNAAHETCPIFPGAPIKAHWGAPDPAHFRGTAVEIAAEFERVFGILERRVNALLALSLDAMDAQETARQLQAIGRII